MSLADLPERQILSIATSIASKWSELGAEFEISPHDITSSLVPGTNTNNNCAVALMERLRSDDCSLDTFKKALIQAELRWVANELSESLNIPNNNNNKTTPTTPATPTSPVIQQTTTPVNSSLSHILCDGIRTEQLIGLIQKNPQFIQKFPVTLVAEIRGHAPGNINRPYSENEVQNILNDHMIIMFIHYVLMKTTTNIVKVTSYSIADLVRAYNIILKNAPLNTILGISDETAFYDYFSRPENNLLLAKYLKENDLISVQIFETMINSMISITKNTIMDIGNSANKLKLVPFFREKPHPSFHPILDGKDFEDMLCGISPAQKEIVDTSNVGRSPLDQPLLNWLCSINELKRFNPEDIHNKLSAQGYATPGDLKNYVHDQNMYVGYGILGMPAGIIISKLALLSK